MHLLATEPGIIADGSSAIDLAQTPGDIIVLASADTEIALLAAALQPRRRRPARRAPRLPAGQDVLHGLADGGRALAHPHARLAQRRDLRLGGAARAGDHRAGVPHAAARGRAPPGDEADHRLGHVLADVAGRPLLPRAADLADEDDGLGLGVGLEAREAVDEVGAVHRVAADADGGGLAEAERAQLLHRLVGERPRARDDADRARPVDVAGHDPDLALAG